MNVREWCSQRVFRFVHQHNLVYNTCWEDPRLDRAALNLAPTDRVVVITSAGCNVLDYALQEPEFIDAVDLNPSQNALLELKLAGIRSLDYEDFFALFGRGAWSPVREVYGSTLRSQLSAEAQGYWDRHIGFFTGEERRPSFYFRGTSGWFAWMVNRYIDRIAKVRGGIEAILAAESLGEQQRIYDKILRPVFWTGFLRWALQRDTTMSLVGVPKAQRDQVDQSYSGGVARFVEDCIEAVFTHLPLRDNYFWRVYLTGGYSPDCCPEYLKPDNFERLRNGLANRIAVHTGSLGDFLGNHDQPVSRFVLLDHMDWLSSAMQPALQTEWQAILDRATSDARILWRSAGLRTDFVDRIVIQRNGLPREVGECLRYNRELAKQLHPLDRVHTYGSFHVADLAS